MYPSPKNPVFGVFVKKTESQLQKYFLIKRVAITFSTNLVEKVLKYFFFFLACAKALKPSFVIWYVHFVSHSTFPIILFKLLLRKRLLILNVHGSDVHVKGLLRSYVYFCLKHADWIIVPSGAYQHLLNKEYDVPLEKLFISPSGGVPDFFYSPPKLRESTPVHFVFVSNLLPEKNGLLLVKALKRIISRDPIKCTLIGTGPEFEAIHRFIEHHALSQHIFMTGRIPRADLPRFFAEADCFIFPSSRESLGLVGLEAMASGLPLIGSAIPGITSYLQNDYNGLCFKNNDEDSLVDTLMDFLSRSPMERFRLAKNAHSSALMYREDVVEKQISNFFFERISN